MMRLRKSKSSLLPILVTTLAAGSTTCAAPAYGLDDDYLKMLEEESNDVMPREEQKQSAATTPGAPPASVFEQELRRSYPGSYYLYSRLDPEQQRQVQEQYERNGSFAGISRMIMDLAAR